MPDRNVVLLTGFEPFGGDLINPSALIADRLHGAEFGGVRLVSTCLPVDIVRLPGEIDRLLDGPRPRAIINLGLAAGRTAVAIERVAVNALDFGIPDNSGQQVRDCPIVPSDPAAYLSRLPLRQSVERLKARAYPRLHLRYRRTLSLQRVHVPGAARARGTRVGYSQWFRPCTVHT